MRADEPAWAGGAPHRHTGRDFPGADFPRRSVTTELVLELVGLSSGRGDHEEAGVRRLERLVGRVRIRCLIDDVTFTVLHPPPELAETLAFSPQPPR